MADCHRIQRDLDLTAFRGAEIDIFDDKGRAKTVAHSSFDKGQDMSFQMQLFGTVARGRGTRKHVFHVNGQIA